MAFAGIGIGPAAMMASETPARVLGFTDRGRLESGCRADLTLMDDNHQVVRTLVGGMTVYERPQGSVTGPL